MRVNLWPVTALAVVAGACATRIAPPATGPSSEPRASWIIRMTGPDGREREVCRSGQRVACALPASAARRRMIATASVYLYPAQQKTIYHGAFIASFFQGSRESQVDYVIEPRKLPTGQSTAGVVTSQPGNYEFRIALFADVPGHPDPHQFVEVVPVRVVAAGAATAE